jgi:hypothetical protein
MKKVSVQFNATIADNMTHDVFKAALKIAIQKHFAPERLGKITSIQINNIEQKKQP